MQFLPYTAALAEAVSDFNVRLASDARTAMFRFGAPSGDGAADATKSPPGSQTFLAVDGGGVVRGGVSLHPQRYWAEGEERLVTNIQLPVSEGLLDREYAYVGPWLIKQVTRRYPHTFAVGMGGIDRPLPKLLGALGWTVQLVPFAFRVIRPAAVVREMPRLGPPGARRAAAAVLTATGLSWTVARALDAVDAARTRGASRLRAASLGTWPDWTTELWNAARPGYGFTAARSRDDLEAWYPDPGRELRVGFYDGDSPVGWAVLLDTPMRESAHFGNLRVGTLLDCMCRPGHEVPVARAALRALASRGADLAVANLTNARWRDALRLVGFLDGPSNYVLATARALTQAAPELGRDPGATHIMRGDGDGRIHL